jgi:hypothetical protein
MTDQQRQGVNLQRKTHLVDKKTIPRQQPLIKPFTVKWPSEFRLKVMLNQHRLHGAGYNDSIAATQQLKIAQQDKINRSLRYKHFAIMLITGINIAAVTALSWLLYTGMASGRGFIALDITLIASVLLLLSYKHNQLDSQEKAAEVSEFDNYDEEDLFIE